MSAQSGGVPPRSDLSTPTPPNTVIDNSDMELESPANMSQSGNVYQNSKNQGNNVSKPVISLNNNSQNQSAINSNNNTSEYGTKTVDNQDKRSVYFYESLDTGPYLVYLENVSPDFSGKLNAIKIGDLILAKHPELDSKISHIESIGRNRIRIKFKDVKSANCLLKSSALHQYNLKQYTPKFITHKYGIIKGVDLDLDENYIKGKIKPFDMHCKFTVDTVKRLNFKQTNENGEKIFKPSKTILVILRAQQLPKYISINHVRIAVTPYEQKVLLCYNCFRYGHLSKQCKSNVRCLKCKNNHNTNECIENETPKCFHCEGEHLTNNIKVCPEYERQKSIKKLMTDFHLSYLEASSKIPKTTYASALISGKSPEKSPTNISLQLDSESIGPRINRNMPFSQSQQNAQHRFTRIIKKTQKRPHLESDDDAAEIHENIIRRVNFPSTSGGILKNPVYASGIRPSGQQEQDCISFSPDSLIKLIINILNILKQSQSFEIQESALISIIKNNLQNQHFNG